MRHGGIGHGLAVIALGVVASTGCALDEGTPIVTGVMDRDASVELTREFVIMRAVPDHPDGFSVARDYHGPLFFEDGCPTEHLQFPFGYMLTGDQRDVDETDGVRWRLLVWETDDPEAHWVKPGEAYGTVPFHFVDDAYGSWASGVDIAIDRIAQ